MHSSSATVDPNEETLQTHQSKRYHSQNPSPSTPAVSVVNAMRPLRTYHDTNRRTAASTPWQPSAAASAARRTCQCQRSPCTCSRTSCSTYAACAANSSPDHGYCRAISVRTPVRSLTVVHIAAKRSRTDRTCVHTCRHIHQTKTLNAHGVTRHLPSRATSTSTRNQRACAMRTRWTSRMRPSPRPASSTEADATRDRNQRRMVNT